MLRVRIKHTQAGKIMSFLNCHYTRTEKYRYWQFGSKPTKFICFSKERAFPLFIQGVMWKTTKFKWFTFGTTEKPINFRKIWSTHAHRGSQRLQPGNVAARLR